MTEEGAPGEAADVPQTSPRELHERLRGDGGVSVLDLRDRDAVADWPIEGAAVENVPIARAVQAKVTGEVAGLVGDLAEPVVVVCPEGEASAEVAAFLRSEGVEASNLAGGMEAWAHLLVGRVVALDAEGVAVRQYERPATGCLSYLVHDGAVGAVVDPLRAFAERYASDAADLGVDLASAVDTHVHADHLSGVRGVASLADAEVVVPAGASDRGLSFDARLATDGDRIDVGGATLTAVHAPGHTSEMTAFEVGDGGMEGDSDAPLVVLTGDSLFLDGVARPDLEDAAEAGAFASRLHGTLRDRLLSLADETIVAPGHRGPDAPVAHDGTLTAPLGAVRERVDALALDEAAFVERVTANAPPRPANHERIVAVNLGRAEAEGAEAFELELGPNNCTATAD